MYLDYLVPSWFEIESRITDEMGYQGRAQFRTYLNEPVASLALNLRRVRAVQSAFNQAEWQAGSILHQRFADLEIASILNELLKVVREMAMIVVGSTLTGGAIGAGIGAFGAGAGAIPLAGAGAAMGLKVSGWILGVLGLASIAEFFIEGLPRIGEYYLDGIRIAWEGTRDESDDPFGRDDPHAISRAAHHIALGHVEVVVLLLGAIVSYLTRGRGDARVLAQEMAASRKGARLGQWMLKHEEGHNPDLIAGGKDVISDFGDRQVNSTIGPQWKSKVESLKRAVESAPKSDGKPALLNVKLHKC